MMNHKPFRAWFSRFEQLSTALWRRAVISLAGRAIEVGIGEDRRCLHCGTPVSCASLTQSTGTAYDLETEP